MLRAARPGLAIAACLAASLTSARADTLLEALAYAYAHNTQLAAARAHQRGVDEQVPQALSGWRPTITVNSGTGYQSVGTDTSSLLPFPLDYDQTVYGGNVQLKLPLYSSGHTSADVARAEATVRAGRADLLSTQQTVLLQAATAYDDVLRARALLALDQQSERLLRQKLQEITFRMQAGQLTRTDVAQTASRLAAAESDSIGAEGDLAAAAARFIDAVGRPPDPHMQDESLLPGLPDSATAAIRLAEANNPAVLASRQRLAAAEHAVAMARAGLLPSVSLSARVGADQGQTFPTVSTESASVTLDLTVPLYQGGAEASQVRQAKADAEQDRLDSETAQFDARKNAAAAYANWRAATEQLKKEIEQVNLASSAYNDVRQEAAVGAISTFELLGQLQDLFSARRSEVQARYSVAVNACQLLVAIGRFTAADLRLNTPLYDPVKHYDKVRDVGSLLP